MLLRNLRRERRNRGMSQAAAAAAAGVTRRVWQLAEAGSEPQPENALKIANFLRLPVDEVWSDDLQAVAT